MDYNSDRNQLFFPEFGRNIQQMVKYSLTIEDRPQRQAYVEYLVALIDQMNPKVKGTGTDLAKIWKQIYVMTNFQLDVDVPEGIDINEESARLSPQTVPYAQRKLKYRHYGRYIPEMIEKIKQTEDPEKRKEFMDIMASYMKVAYNHWSDDHIVSNEMIHSDMKMLSDGELELGEDAEIDIFKNLYRASNNNNNRKGGKNRKGRGSNNNRHKNNNRRGRRR